MMTWVEAELEAEKIDNLNEVFYMLMMSKLRPSLSCLFGKEIVFANRVIKGSGRLL